MHDITITIQSSMAFEYFNSDQNVYSFDSSPTVILEFFFLSAATISSFLSGFLGSHPFYFSEPNVTDLTYLPSM